MKPAAVHHDRLDVTRLPLMDEGRRDAQPGRQVRALEIDHDQIGLPARLERAAVGDRHGAVPVRSGPAQRLLGRRPPAVVASHPFYEQPGADHLDHVLGHVVGAEGDGAAERLQIGDPRAQPTPRGDRRVERDRGTGAPEQPLLLRRHAAAVRRNQPVAEEPDIVEILGRQPAAHRPDGGDLAPELVQVHGSDAAQPVLQGAQLSKQRRRAHVGRPGGDTHRDAAVGGAVPSGVQLLDPAHAALGEARVDLEAALIANAAPGLVPGPLAQEEPKSGIGDRRGIALDVGAVLEHRRSPAPQRLECRQPAHGHPLVGREVRRREWRQPAGEGRFVGRREVLVDPFGDDQGEMRVDVRKARHHELAASVDRLGVREPGQDRVGRPDRGDPIALDRERGTVEDRVVGIDGDQRRVADHDRHSASPTCRGLSNLHRPHGHGRQGRRRNPSLAAAARGPGVGGFAHQVGRCRRGAVSPAMISTGRRTVRA
jgi:hypothetical protein